MYQNPSNIPAQQRRAFPPPPAVPASCYPVAVALLVSLSLLTPLTASDDFTALQQLVSQRKGTESEQEIEQWIACLGEHARSPSIETCGRSLALRGVLLSEIGRSWEAFMDFQAASAIAGNLTIALPGKLATSPDSIDARGKQPVMDVLIHELFYEACVDVAPNQWDKVAFAHVIAEQTLRLLPDSAKRDSVKRDISISAILKACDPAALSLAEANQLAQAVFDYDATTGALTVKDCKWAANAILLLAKFLHEHPSGLDSQESPPYSSIQMGLLSTSLRSVTDAAYLRGMFFVSDRFAELGYATLAARIRGSLNGEVVEEDSRLKDAMALALEGEFKQAQTLLETFASKSPIGLLHLHGNPVLDSFVKVDSPLPYINLLAAQSKIDRVGIPLDANSLMQAHAIHSFAVFHDPTSGYRDRNQALESAVRIFEYLKEQKEGPFETLFLLVNPLLPDCEDLHTEKLYHDIKEFCNAVEKLQQASLLNPTQMPAVGPFTLARMVEAYPNMAQSSLVLRVLVERAIANGHYELAKKSLRALDDIEGQSAYYWALESIYVRRTAAGKGTISDCEAKVLQGLLRQLEATDATDLAALREAIKLCQLPMSHATRNELATRVSVYLDLQKNECRLLIPEILEHMAVHSSPFFDGILAQLWAQCLQEYVTNPKDLVVKRNVQLVLAAIASCGADQCHAALNQSIHTMLAPLRMPEAETADGKGAETTEQQAATPASLGLQHQHAIFRWVTEAMLPRWPVSAHRQAIDFYTAHREFLTVTRPAAFDVLLARAFPTERLGKQTYSPFEDASFAHLALNVERLTGSEYARHIAEKAGLRLGTDLVLFIELNHLLSATTIAPDSLTLESTTGLSVLAEYDRLKTEMDKVWKLGQLQANWWESVCPESIIEHTTKLLEYRQVAGESLSGVEPASALALRLDRAVAHIGIMDAPAAVEDLMVLLEQGDEFSAEIFVPFLPEPLTAREALALAQLFSHQADPDQYVASVLPLLKNSRAMRSTSFFQGLEALEELITNQPMDNADAIARRLQWFESVKRSGLYPVIAGSTPSDLPESKPDLTCSARRQNLARDTVGLRLPTLQPEGAVVWKPFFEVEAVQLAQFGMRCDAVDAALYCWLNGQLELSEQQLQANSFKNNCDMVKAIHDRKHSVGEDGVERGEDLLFAKSNVYGVRALIEGKFDVAEESLHQTIDQVRARSRFDVQRLYRGRSQMDTLSAEGTIRSLATPHGRGAMKYPKHLSLVESLAAYRNLSLLYLLTGRHEDALAFYMSSLELESADSNSKDMSSFLDLDLSPSIVAVHFPSEEQLLRRTSHQILQCIQSLEAGNLPLAQTVLQSISPAFKNAPPVQRLKSEIAGRELAGLDPHNPLYDAYVKRLDTALADLARLPVDAENEEVDLAITLGRASLQSTEEQRSQVQQSVILALKRRLPDLHQQVHPTTVDLLSVPNWTVSYLEAAPLVIQKEMVHFEATDELARYIAIVGAPLHADCTVFATSLILRPFALQRYSAFDPVLATLIPQTPEALSIVSRRDASGMRKLDWILAAAVGSGGSQTKRALSSALEAMDTTSPEFSSILRAYAVNYPVDAVRAALRKLTWADQAKKVPNDVSQFESILGAQILNSQMRGARQYPVPIRPGTGSLYRDADAFFYFHPAEPDRVFVEQLLEMLGVLTANPQAFAQALDELEQVTRPDRLMDSELFPNDMTAYFHCGLAKHLANVNIPASLAILLRYCDRESPMFADARCLAAAHDYATLRDAMWLAEVPGAAWPIHIGPMAWRTLALDPQKEVRVHAPAPDSSFLRAIETAIAEAENRGERTPALRIVTESNLALRCYSALVSRVCAEKDLVCPAVDTTTLDQIHSFSNAIEQAKNTIALAVVAKLEGNDLSDSDRQTRAHAMAAAYVTAELQAQTIELFFVVSGLKKQGRLGYEFSMSRLPEMSGKLLAELSEPTIISDVDDQAFEPRHECEYDPAMKLVARRIFISETKGVYEETFELKNEQWRIGGDIPLSYLGSLQKSTRLFDHLGISLAKREHLLRLPEPIRLSIDLAMKSPTIAWPAFMQESGHEHLHTFLSSSCLHPENAAQFMAQVAAEPMVIDVDSRITLYRNQSIELAKGYYASAFVRRSLARAQEIPNEIVTKLLFLIPIVSQRNINKDRLLKHVNDTSLDAESMLARNRDQDLFRLRDPSDPPRFVRVEETKFSEDFQNWYCRYTIETALGNRYRLERQGSVANLPEVCKSLIERNPQLVTRLGLDLGGLSTSPEAQIRFALQCTNAIEDGKISLLRGMQVLGLTTEEIREFLPTEDDFAVFIEKGDWLEKRKRDLSLSIAEASGLLAKSESVPANHDAMNQLIAHLDQIIQKLEQDATVIADGTVEEVKLASRDINILGIPGVLHITFQGGDIVSFQVLIGFQGDLDTMTDFDPIFPVAIRDLDVVPDYHPSELHYVDPRVELELP